jgi:hypothetical protein
MAKIKHTRNENGQNFTHQNKTTLFWRKKTKINLHQNFPIYGMLKVFLMGFFFNIKACFDVGRKTYTFSTYLSTLKRQETTNPCFLVFSL